MATDQLADSQLTAFDNLEAITEPRWARIKALLERDFPSGDFSFVDIGGGNGAFADKLLAAFPHAKGTVVDNSQLLLGRNKASARKMILEAGALDFAKHISTSVDIIFCNWLFHHLVDSNSYKQSRKNVRDLLFSIRGILSSRGRLSVMECDYNGYIPSAPGRIVFALTSSNWFAPFAKRLGANTAGVGVSYLCHQQWKQEFSSTGFGLLDYSAEEPWRWPAYRHVGLLLREVRHGHYWLRATTPLSS